MSEPSSNIGDENQSAKQPSKKKAASKSPFEAIKTELHTIVDNLQLDEPLGKPPRRPLWQRVLVWQIPIWLVAFLVILSYNPRLQTCEGVKAVYNNQTYCIVTAQDSLAFIEQVFCDSIATLINPPVVESLQFGDFTLRLKNTYDASYASIGKYSFGILQQHAEDIYKRKAANSTSFLRNKAIAYFNATVMHIKAGNTDLACSYAQVALDGQRLELKDSIFSTTEISYLESVCQQNNKISENIISVDSSKKPITRPISKPTRPKPITQPKKTVAPKVNLKAQTVIPSVTFGKKPDLQSIESANRQKPIDIDQAQVLKADSSKQNSKPCNDFNCAYYNAQTLFRQKAYQKAIENLDIAEGYSNANDLKQKEMIKQLRQQITSAMELEKKQNKQRKN